jgi:hypothetical protein
MAMTNAERQQRWRERRATEQSAALAPVPDAPPRDPDELLLPAVEVTIGALKLGEPFQAAAQLARSLARTIDEAADPAAALRVLGPQLLKALESIGGSPAARAKMPAPPRPPSKVAQLRAAHWNSPAKRARRGA